VLIFVLKYKKGAQNIIHQLFIGLMLAVFAVTLFLLMATYSGER